MLMIDNCFPFISYPSLVSKQFRVSSSNREWPASLMVCSKQLSANRPKNKKTQTQTTFIIINKKAKPAETSALFACLARSLPSWILPYLARYYPI